MGDYIKWLSEISKEDVSSVGGKGANLGEMYRAGFPVPQAFVVTTKAFFYFLKKSRIEDDIKQILSRIDVNDTKALEEKSAEIRKIIEEAPLPDDLEIGILEAYDHFNIDLKEVENSPGALAILKSAREPVFVAVRSSATAEDLENASFAGQQDSFINVKGNNELIKSIKSCFASIFTARSIYYRKKKGFSDFVGIACVVQRMVNSDKAGVMFSHHPVRGNDNILIEAVFGQGEGIVSGKIKPDQYVVNRDLQILETHVEEKKLAVIRTASGQTKTISLSEEKSKEQVLTPAEMRDLAEYAIKIEKHYGKPQDIEFAIEDENIFILQTRAITVLKKEEENPELEGRVLTQGLGASPGIASGIVRIVRSVDDLEKIKPGNVLVTTMTNPDMVVSMQKAAAIVTSEGGITAHAAIVSREMGIPAVVGTGNCMDVLNDGDEVTVDGYTGKVYEGRLEARKVEIKPIVKTKTKIKVIVDLPDFAERAAKTQAYGVGLVRLEGIIASSKKHPLEYEKNSQLEDYKNLIKMGLEKIADNFIGKPIWVRTSDIRSDEYSNLQGAPEIERNPMLGNHGIRFSLKHLGILKAELRAIKELAEKGHKFGVMFPQIISVDEIKRLKKIFQELEMSNVEFGVMIETPAASVLIRDICEQGIDFVSIGTNDLTQYTLAVDRGNEDVQYLYDEMNWAVLKQISRVLRECKKQGVHTSICGQAGSKKEMVKFLVEQGIDSISVNSDAAYEISVYVKSLEEGGGEHASEEHHRVFDEHHRVSDEHHRGVVEIKGGEEKEVKGEEEVREYKEIERERLRHKMLDLTNRAGEAKKETHEEKPLVEVSSEDVKQMEGPVPEVKIGFSEDAEKEEIEKKEDVGGVVEPDKGDVEKENREMGGVDEENRQVGGDEERVGEEKSDYEEEESGVGESEENEEGQGEARVEEEQKEEEGEDNKNIEDNTIDDSDTLDIEDSDTLDIDDAEESEGEEAYLNDEKKEDLDSAEEIIEEASEEDSPEPDFSRKENIFD